MARELVVPWSSARMKGMAGIVLPPEGRTQSAKGVRVDAHNSHAPRCPTHEVNDEKDHKQRQQNVDRADGYVESEKADQPCDEEQERDCQPHTKSLQRRSIELLCLGRMAKEIEGLLGSAACSGKRADPCTSHPDLRQHWRGLQMLLGEVARVVLSQQRLDDFRRGVEGGVELRGVFAVRFGH